MTMEDRLSQSVASQRFYMRLYSIFAALAVTLAAVGIFGVMSYSVSQRTHEFGIRMALGADRGDILKLVVRQGLVLVLIGVAIGVVAALGLTRLIASRLYGVTATDPVTFTAVALVLVGVALLASYIPARRATKVDPLVAFRHE
jgi:putative ABC transport system permease protein